MKTASIIFAAALSFGQTTAKKESAPATKNAAILDRLAAKSDSWQKSKECAAQAEKVVAGWLSPATEWQNHYSPKYDRCFVSLSFFSVSKDDKVFPTMYSTVLVDAFERSRIASTCSVPGHSDCVKQIAKTGRDVFLNMMSRALNGKPFAEATIAEQEIVLGAVDRDKDNSQNDSSLFYCGIEGKSVECDKAKSFISEHLKN
jgi:hypothetical protein